MAACLRLRSSRQSSAVCLQRNNHRPDCIAAGLIAPRPLLIEAGDRDGIFPIASVKKSVRLARNIFKLFSPSAKIETDYFKGGHAISGRKAFAFLQRELHAAR